MALRPHRVYRIHTARVCVCVWRWHRVVQSAREAVQQVTSELTQLVTGPLGLHERLQHLQVEEGCR